jgi:NhaA family Na+:H+ antiporter
VALYLANSPYSQSYLAFWNTKVSFSFGSFQFAHSLKHLINDGLMVIFFFVIGLEVKREFVLGELRDHRKAALPIAAALGGMVVPALIYLMLQSGGEAQRGWGIPMATDIAFVVGCMTILGDRIPASLRVMLLTLAIADDIGAILVIAIGYTSDLDTQWLAVGVAGIILVRLFARLGVRNFAPYIILGILVWYGFLESGVHATIAGVILGLMTPARNYITPELFANAIEHAREMLTGEEWETKPHRAEGVRQIQWAARETISPLEYLEGTLHPWVAFAIVPLFALANAGVPIELSSLQSSTALAVAIGLVAGKPIGILIASRLAVAVGIAKTPDYGWTLVFAAGCLAGIGFTMSLFVAELALPDQLLTRAKIGVLFGSVAAAILGMTLITLFPQADPDPASNEPPVP